MVLFNSIHAKTSILALAISGSVRKWFTEVADLVTLGHRTIYIFKKCLFSFFRGHIILQTRKQRVNIKLKSSNHIYYPETQLSNKHLKKH